MRGQRSEVIDFKVVWRAKTRRVARRLLLETTRIRRPIPTVPRSGRAAAVCWSRVGECSCSGSVLISMTST